MNIKQQVGRPSKHNWAAEKEAIEGNIRKGMGLCLLAKPYNMSPAGMKRVVKSLGLRTLGMKEGVNEAALRSSKVAPDTE